MNRVQMLLVIGVFYIGFGLLLALRGESVELLAWGLAGMMFGLMVRLAAIREDAAIDEWRARAKPGNPSLNRILRPTWESLRQQAGPPLPRSERYAD